MKTALFLSCMICLAPYPCRSQVAGEGRVSINEDLLTVHVTDAPLFSILEEISAETGMKVKVDPMVDKNVTAFFENVPIDRGIARLVHPLDYVIKWRRIKEGGESYEEITSVEVFKKGERDKAQKVISRTQPSHRGLPEGDPDRRDIESVRERRAQMPVRRRVRKKPARSSVTKVNRNESERGTGGGSSSATTLRIRRFESILKQDSYDELSP